MASAVRVAPPPALTDVKAISAPLMISWGLLFFFFLGIPSPFFECRPSAHHRQIHGRVVRLQHIITSPAPFLRRFDFSFLPDLISIGPIEGSECEASRLPSFPRANFRGYAALIAGVSTLSTLISRFTLFLFLFFFSFFAVITFMMGGKVPLPSGPWAVLGSIETSKKNRSPCAVTS